LYFGPKTALLAFRAKSEKAAMQERVEEYLERARDFEKKVQQTDDPIMKMTYHELARSYRTLATYVPKAANRAAKE
jgi:hypothetical protein